LTVGSGWSVEVFSTQGLRDTFHDALMSIDYVESDIKKAWPAGSS
jgi:hypothetical protein